MSALRPASAFLVVRNANARWPNSAPSPDVVRMTKEKPRLQPGEIAVKVNLIFDANVFFEFLPSVDVNVGGNIIAGPVEATVGES